MKIWDDPLDIVVSPLHALAIQRKPDARPTGVSRDSAGPQYLTTREIVLQAFGSLRAEITTGMTTNYLEVLKNAGRHRPGLERPPAQHD